MLEIVSCEQGTEDWFKARMGIPTASMFDAVMANGRGNSPSKTRRTYMLKLIGERLTGEPMDTFSNAHMERGKVMEEEARACYEFMTDLKTQQVGFIRNGDKGASPDSLIGVNGCLEIKTKLPHLQLDVVLNGKLPPEHRDQVQGQLWVAEREWCDFVSYWPNTPLFCVRVFRDDERIKELTEGVEKFMSELVDLEEKLRGMM